nr:integrase, catalytic region, zinc finger, CCHC-type, peptidase aspartic, catalytic [Tanacetum cinerariifolium]
FFARLSEGNWNLLCIRTQATIQNGQAMVQNVQGRQFQGYAGNAGKNQASGARVVNTVGNVRANQTREISCYNCNDEGHIAKQRTVKKRVKDSEWLKDKMLLAQAQEAGVANYVDAYDSDCDDEATTNAIFMENLSPVGFINGDTVEPRYDSELLSEIVEIVFWYLDFGCSKHMIGHRDKLINFVSKFSGTVRFDNNHFTAIMEYRDLQMGNILISRVYYVEGLGHNVFFVGQFCDSDLEVAFKKHTFFVRSLEGVDLLLGSRASNLYTISLADMMKSSLICLFSKASKIKSWLWPCRISHLNFDTINQLAKQGLIKGLPKLKYTKDHMCSACQIGKSKKESHPHKPEPSINEKLQMLQMDLYWEALAKSGIFIGYSPSKKAYRIYNKRTRQIMKTMNVQFDELTQMAFEQHGSGPKLQGLTSGYISSGLVLNQATSTPSDITGASSSTSIDKDAPSPSTSPNIETSNSSINSTNVEPNEEVVEFDSDTFTNPFTPLDTSSAESSFRVIDTSNMHTFQQPHFNTQRWTKDHSLVIIIGNSSKPVSTRCQLAADALWCYFHAFLVKEKLKNYKEAMIESS